MSAAAGTGDGKDELTIRAGRPEDSARCQSIAIAAWRQIHAVRRGLLGDAIYDHLHPDWQTPKAAQIDRSFTTHPEWTRVAVVRAAAGTSGGEQIAGFVTFRLDRDRRVGVIGNNAVDPAWARRGIATSLYREVLDIFRAAGMRVAEVNTGLDAGHAPALNAYRKVGFSAEAPSVTLYQEL